MQGRTLFSMLVGAAALAMLVLLIGSNASRPLTGGALYGTVMLTLLVVVFIGGPFLAKGAPRRRQRGAP